MGTSDWISLGSLIVAFSALLYSWVTDRKLRKQQLEINRQQLLKSKEEDDEKKKAIIEANIYETYNGKIKHWKMKVYNKGKATAYNIHFSSPDIENNKSGIMLLISDSLIPYPKLHPQTSFEIPLVLVSQRINNPEITFIWDDDFGKDNKRDQILNI